ncbi:hypothetical protein, conserved [Trypanosoma brucei gambiense DAL972]|uniref:Bromo domain-containing protein n=2 Tax=Trypanosoma brucei TaxID=5691 RepID=D0A3R1_TRYB9|nr:hypothetical protein, conserved [Trypanosoma brucei gambiense DAL972]RHW69338.1 putative bromodomain protein [Trypanosoma brucei equiperdum]CBH15905.1 hypothetical protein, conserved [Trypanosoma brucei gambiense DAL972]|eukprot:XP_011778169.1 hypothetical protein, conserved [Trypanosoma brucei gambiense DAL972]
MSDTTRRVKLLWTRVRRKYLEVHHYLDTSFYKQCRSILHVVMDLDRDGIFARDPSKLPDYRMIISHPMWWDLIKARLTRYEYTSPSAFINDMRLVVQNCYDYNREESPFSTLARRIEIAMEDLFVTELSLDPPDPREVLRLGGSASKSHGRQLWEIICRYEGCKRGETPKHQQIRPAELKCATRRRLIMELRRLSAKARGGTHGGRSEKAASAQRAQPPASSSRRPEKAKFPTRSILETDDDVYFREEQNVPQEPPRKEPRLERVPQNERAGFSSFALLSPVEFDEGSDEVQFNEEARVEN